MKLLALLCPDCKHPLEPDNDHLLSVCENCYSPIYLDEMGLRKISVLYAQPQAETEVMAWRPFWLFEGQVTITHRRVQGGSKSSARDSEAFWAEPHHFYIPAWDLSIQAAQTWGQNLLQAQTLYQAGDGPPHPNLTPLTVSVADAKKLLEFIILSLEAQRDDWLRDLEFTVDLNEPALWALPCTEGEQIVAK